MAFRFRIIIFDRKQYLSNDTINHVISGVPNGIRKDKGKEEEAMKDNLKNTALKVVAKIAFITAQKASGAASWWDMYQPKEPKALRQSN